MRKHLLVTGYFNIKRNEWNTIFKRSEELYLENAKRILSTPEDIVIFIKEEYRQFILENRNSNYVTHLINTEYEDLEYFKYEKQIERIMNSDKFKNMTKHNTTKVPEFNNPKYLVIIWSKLNLVNRAINMFPNYTHYAWIDFGLHAHIIPNNYPPFYPNGITSDLIRIHCRTLPKDDDKEENNFLIYSNERFCSGSITGSKKIFKLFEQLVHNEISKLLSNNIVHCEQSIFVLVYLKYKKLFSLSYGDDWEGILRNYYNSDHRYFYFGEFGFFNAYILNFLEKIEENVEIVTLKDYAKLIENEFPGKFRLIYTDFLFTEHRDCSNLKNLSSQLFQNLTFFDLENKTIKIDLSNYKNLNYREINKLGVLAYEYLDVNNNYEYISKPLKSTYILKTTKKPIFVFFPRFRSKKDSLHRNITPSIYNDFCRIIKEIYPSSLTVQVGAKSETLDIFCDIKIYDILESIDYLKNADLLITPHSGYYYFAKNCGCYNICVFQSNTNTEYMSWFNPFKSITTFSSNKDDVILIFRNLLSK